MNTYPIYELIFIVPSKLQTRLQFMVTLPSNFKNKPTPLHLKIYFSEKHPEPLFHVPVTKFHKQLWLVGNTLQGSPQWSHAGFGIVWSEGAKNRQDQGPDSPLWRIRTPYSVSGFIVKVAGTAHQFCNYFLLCCMTTKLTTLLCDGVSTHHIRRGKNYISNSYPSFRSLKLFLLQIFVGQATVLFSS